MNKFKKFLSLLLAFVMTLSLMPVSSITAMAADDPNSNAWIISKAVDRPPGIPDNNLDWEPQYWYNAGAANGRLNGGSIAWRTAENGKAVHPDNWGNRKDMMFSGSYNMIMSGYDLNVWPVSELEQHPDNIQEWAVLAALTLTKSQQNGEYADNIGTIWNAYPIHHNGGYIQLFFGQPPLSDVTMCAVNIAYHNGLKVDPSTGYSYIDSIDVANQFLMKGYNQNRLFMQAIAYCDIYMHYHLTDEILSMNDIFGMYVEKMGESGQVPFGAMILRDNPALVGYTWDDLHPRGPKEVVTNRVMEGVVQGTELALCGDGKKLESEMLGKYRAGTIQSETGSRQSSGPGTSLVPIPEPPIIWTDQKYGDIDLYKPAEDQSQNGNANTVAGIAFTFTNTRTGEVYNGVTDGNGFIHVHVKVDNATSQDYYRVTESAPAKYRSTVSPPYDENVLVVWNQTTTMTSDSTPNLVNKLVMGGIRLNKYDNDFNTETTPQGDSTFNRTGFYIKNITGETIKYRDAAGERWIANGQDMKDSSGNTAVFYTDANGKLETANNAFTYGRYEIREANVPEYGYDINNSWRATVDIVTDLQIVDVAYNSRILEPVSRSGQMTVQKFDTDIYKYPHHRGDTVSDGKPQGDATLAGATIDVFNKSAHHIWYNGREIAVNGLVDTITTDAKGVASIQNLPYGTYLLKENTPPTGYLKNSDWEQTIQIHQATGARYHVGTNGATKAQSVRDDVYRAKIEIQKFDYENANKLALGNTGSTADPSLIGAEIQVINRSQYPIYYHGPNGDRWVEVGEVIDTYTTDETGYCASPAMAFPYGTYELQEVKAPIGYVVDTSWHPIVEVRQHNITYSVGCTADTKQLGLFDKVMRGDIKFNKVDSDTTERLANVPFRVTSLTTGETHIVVTDPNGVFDSTIFPNKQESGYGSGANQSSPMADAYDLSLTNKNDLAVYPDGTVNDPDLNPYAAVWFTGRTDETSMPKEGLRPFPYDTYTFEELRCQANEGKVLIKFTTTVSSDQQIVDRGSVDDYTPQIVTMLLDQDTQDHVSTAKADVVLIDRITYSNVHPGVTYYLKGVLMDKSTGNAIMIDGSPVTGETSFTPERVDGSVNLTFMLNAQNLKDKVLVAFVTLYEDASMTTALYESVDINNEDETVRFPSIRTSLTGENGEKEVVSGESVVLIDTVSYNNLTPNQTYVMHAELVNKENGQVLLSGDGGQLIREVTFKPTTPDGTVEVPFLFDSSLCEGKTMVCFETLTRNTVPVAEHKDLDDEDQTVTIPSISTTLGDEDGNHVVYASEIVTLVDTVEYKALKIGREYTMRGTLMDKITGKPVVDASGNDVTAETSFTPTSNDGTVEITFEVESEVVEGKTLVAYEKCYWTDIVIATHEDIDDEDQTVYVPKIRTTLADSNGEKELYADGKTKVVVDTVEYEGLKVGESYTMSGQLINKATDAVLAEAETTFLARTDHGTIQLTFVINTEDLQGQSVVAFEELTLENRLVGDHKDKEDKDQTVTFPKIRTTAHTAEDAKEILAAGGQMIIDTIRYENLVPGNIYTLRGVIVDAEDGKSPKDDKGEPFTGVLTFTAPDANGTIDVNIPIDASQLEGKTIVIFEELDDVNDRIIATHEDLSDTDQTITIPKIRTTLVSEIDDNLAFASENVTLTDTVVYENLIPGKQYTMTGTLVDKATGAAFKTESVTFTPDSKDGSIDVVFTFDATELQAVTLVAFESLKNDVDVVVGIHEDIEDEDQSIKFPKIRTSASNIEGKKEIFATDKIIINDIVSYENLKPGYNYVMKGYLVDKANPDTVVATAETKFKPTTEEGTITVKFILNTKELEGMTLVAFEECTYNDEIVAQHKDLEDKEQTLNIPKIRTNAHDGNEEKEFLADGTIRLVDTVLYWNLTPGEQYTIEGILHDQRTGKVMKDSDGNPITGQTTFKPESPDGEVDVIFIIDGNAMEDKTIIVEETIYNIDDEVVAHEFLDENEIVWVPKIRTTLVDENGEHVTFAGEEGEEITLTDTIAYWNLQPGQPYVAEGVLMNPETEEVAIDSNGNEIRATKEFTPESANGSVDIDFTFDASAIDGTTLVAFEYVSIKATGKLVGQHEDYSDTDQTVHIPHVQSHASNAAGEKEFNASGIMTLNDALEYDHFMPGEKYTVEGVLIDKATGEPVLDPNGDEIRTSSRFFAQAESNEGLYCPCIGSMKNAFKFNASEMEGKTLVVYEYIYHNGILVAKHTDIDDPEQTITFPKIRTTLHGENGEKEFLAEGIVQIIDTVAYWNLVPGTNYTLDASLIDKETKKGLKDIYGYEITATASFTPDEVDGTADVVFEFDASQMKNKTTVAFETLSNEYSIVATHNDINDADQTVTFPEIRTSLVADDGTRVALASENLHLTDTVTFKNLIPGNEYTLTGTLMNQMTGEPVTDAEGNPVQSTSTFTAPDKDGTWDIEFTFDASELAGYSVVAFEQLSNSFGVVAKHEDINDEAQTVAIPEIKTTASDEDGNKDFFADGKVTVIDVVEYKNLPLGRYRLEGRLMDKETGEVLIDHKGKEVVASTTFRVLDTEGEVTLKFVFDSTDLAGHTLVAFEQLFLGDTLVAIHEDLEDEEQTVRFPDIHTEATDQFYQHATNTGTQTKIIDRVDYTNLIPGETYVMIGKLVNKADGKVLKDYAGDEVVANTMFVPEEESGSIEVVFIVDTTALVDGALVAYEQLTHDNRLVAIHEDVEDEQQSVYFPSIRTTAKIDGEDVARVTPDTETITITDTVVYNDLVANETYTISGTLMDRETGAVVKGEDGEAIIGSIEFTPTSTSGSIDVVFEVPVSVLLGEDHNITKIVVFERLILGPNTIAKHEDYSDDEQTVYVPTVTKIRKLDASSWAPVANAVFKIEDRGLIGSDERITLVPQQQGISDADGYVYFSVLPNHEYAIVEIAAPDGYYIDSTEHIVDADALGNLTGEIVLYNVKGGTVIITKTNAVTGDPMRNCEITIYRKVLDEAKTEAAKKEAAKKLNKAIEKLEVGKDYQLVYKWEEEFKQLTDRKGRVYFYTEDPGQFMFKETKTVDAFYLNSDENEFMVDASLRVTGDLALMNVPFGTVVVQKVDPSGKPLQGAKLAFWDAYDRKLGEAVTDKKGRVYFVSPGPGKYYYTEVEAPQGFAMTKNRYHFEVHGDYTIVGQLEFVNSRTPDSPSYSTTGDSQNLALWASLLSLALIGSGAVFVVKRRKKEDRG